MTRLQLRYSSALVGISLLFASLPLIAQTAPPLGVVQQFTVLGASGVTGSTGLGTTVNGDVGSSPTPSVTNFPPSTATPPFIVHMVNDTTVQQAHADSITAYNFLFAEGPGVLLSSPQLDTRTLTAGIYSFPGGAADLAMNGTLVLNGPGIFVFQVDSALTANVGSNVIGTANPCNVFWRVGTSATLNGTSFLGQVFADASITVGAGSNVTGRTIAGAGPDPDGAVTMAGSGGNTIGGCAVPVIACPVITVNPPALPNGTVAVPYNATITASNGSGTYTFAVTSGSLPNGLTLSSAGAIAGTPTVMGPFAFTITATDLATGCMGSQVYAVTILPAAFVPVGGPTLDVVGLTILMILLVGAGLFVMNKVSM